MTENTMLPFERPVLVDIEEEMKRGSLDCLIAVLPSGLASTKGLAG